MEFSENVTILNHADKTIYLIGTAHISSKSVTEVADVIQAVKPDTVCVELCATRHQALTQENQWSKLNIIDVIKQGKALMLLASLALSSFQRKMGSQLGVKPGAELLEGVLQAEAAGARLELVDRDVQITLKRTWGNLSLWNKLKVFAGLFDSVFSDAQLSEEDLERMKEKDQLNAMMEEFARVMPAVKKPLIDERDQFLMNKIENAEGKTIVAVVGAGHVKGMMKHLGQPVDIQKLSEIPAPSPWFKAAKWIIPLIVIALFGWGFYSHRGENLQEMIFAWVLPNSIMAGLFTLAAGGKIASVISAFIASPITSLNPALGAGMVAGTVEVWFRKPTVADCERIPEDIQSFKGFYNNPFTKVLLVFAMANLGSSLGSIIGLSWLISIFA